MRRPIDLDVVVALSHALRARAAVLALLTDAGIEATLDGGAFFPQPVGVLIGLPALVARGLRSRTFELTVTIVSGDPMNAELAVDRLYALADDVAAALRVAAYRPTSWRGGVNAEPLPAIELTVTATVTEEATQT
jgi:hypothetical protein